MIREIAFEDIGIGLGPKGQTFGRFDGQITVRHGLITEIWLCQSEARYDPHQKDIIRSERWHELLPGSWLHKALLEELMVHFAEGLDESAEPREPARKVRGPAIRGTARGDHRSRFVEA